MTRLLVLLGLLAGIALFVGGCRSTAPPTLDSQFGAYHPADGWHKGRRTLRIAPPDPALEYFTYPAVFDSVVVRVAPYDSASVAAQAIPVEVLVKGALIDDCSTLHDAEHTRKAHLINATLTIRRPAGVVCRRVEVPFRYYWPLEDPLPPGAYTLRLNGGVFPFVVPPPGES